MFRRVIKKIMAPHLLWREDAVAYVAYARQQLRIPNGFDELTELYVNALFRGIALSMTGLFIPVYLLQLGYDFTAILMVVAVYFTLRGFLLDIVAGFTVAKIGPKRTMLIGYGLLICSTMSFLLLETMHWPIWLLGGLWGASSSFFFVPFNVGFSKVKHSKHGGRELGYLNVMDRIGHFIGPLISAAVATAFGGKYIFLAAGVMLLIGAVALLQTAEPTKLNQKLDFNGLDISLLKREIVAFSGVGVQNGLHLYLWPLYLGLFILGSSTVYAELGALASISVMGGAVAAYGFGKVIDQGNGRKLLRISASMNALLHVTRIFVGSYPAAIGVNMASEFTAEGYRMAFFKGYYDSADEHPGYRIVYLTSMEVTGCIVRAAIWWLLVLLSMVLAVRTVTSIGFMFAATASLLVLVERFKGLKPKPIMQGSHE